MCSNYYIISKITVAIAGPNIYFFLFKNKIKLNHTVSRDEFEHLFKSTNQKFIYVIRVQMNLNPISIFQITNIVRDNFSVSE